MDDRRRDGGANSTLRTKEQGKHLTRNEHDDYDDDDDERLPLSTIRYNVQKLYIAITWNLCFCMDLGTNDKLFLTEHQNIGFYNRGGECLQRGTDWVFK